MARRYCGRHEDINDIIQEGCIGLMKAIEAFDINDGTPFSVYALYWVRRLINEFKIGTSQLVKQRNRPRIVHQASKLRNKMFNELEREPNIEEVHEKFNELNSTSKVSSASDFVDIEYIYIDGFCTPIEDSYQLKVVSEYDRASETHPTCEKKFKEEQDKLMVKNLLDGLTDNETKVIKMYFGIDEPIESNINMISYRLGITPQRVSQICISAMGKMKKKSKKYVHARYS
jgi:RNA polymerase primary sigma factor